MLAASMAHADSTFTEDISDTPVASSSSDRSADRSADADANFFGLQASYGGLAYQGERAVVGGALLRGALHDGPSGVLSLNYFHALDGDAGTGNLEMTIYGNWCLGPACLRIGGGAHFGVAAGYDGVRDDWNWGTQLGIQARAAIDVRVSKLTIGVSGAAMGGFDPIWLAGQIVYGIGNGLRRLDDEVHDETSEPYISQYLENTPGGYGAITLSVMLGYHI